MAVKAIPDGYRSVTPYLIVKGAVRAIDFYKKVFGAAERMRMDGPNGTVGHAEIEIGDSVIMLADECPDMGFRSPQSIGGSGVSLHLYVQDVDACFNRAVAEVSDAARRLLTSLHTHAPARDRAVEAEKARERSRLRFGQT